MSLAPRRAVLRAARHAVRAFLLSPAFAVVLAGGATAHGQFILQLGAERVQPGGAIEVRGDLGVGEAFEVALIAKADGGRRLIATIPATEEGHFLTYVTVPSDVPVGDYLLEVAVDLSVIRAPLTVAGSPITGEVGDGPDHADPLIQPMSSRLGGGTGTGAGAAVAPGAGGGAAAAAGASAGPAAGGAIPVSTRTRRSPIDGALVVGLAALASIALVGGLRIIGRRHSAR
jgi:hypothetical protein